MIESPAQLGPADYPHTQHSRHRTWGAMGTPVPSRPKPALGAPFVPVQNTHEHQPQSQSETMTKPCYSNSYHQFISRNTVRTGGPLSSRNSMTDRGNVVSHDHQQPDLVRDVSLPCCGESGQTCPSASTWVTL